MAGLRFLEGLTVQRFAGPDQARAAAGAVARLTARLADLPGPALVEPIAGFHDFTRRLAAFEAAVVADEVGRASGCRSEIAGVRRTSSLAAQLEAARAGGLLPERLVHNDAKAENILFDPAGERVRAVLDLDTVAPGTVLFDVGDLIRSGAATGAEDTRLKAGLDVDVEIAEAVVEGFLAAVPGVLGNGERSMLALAGPLMAFEAAMRFLTDHLAGDLYFRIAGPGQNLVRARNQLRLVDRLVALGPRLGRRRPLTPPVVPPVPPVTEVVLDAGAVARTFRIEGGTVRTVSIRGTNGEVAVAGPELAVVVDGVRFHDGELILARPPDASDGTLLSWSLSTPDGEVQILVMARAQPDLGVIRTSVVVTGSGRLDRIELELWEGVEVEGFTAIEPGPPPNAGSIELGQPVFGPGFFAGIEHPGAENLATADGCHCSIAYGVDLEMLDAVATRPRCSAPATSSTTWSGSVPIPTGSSSSPTTGTTWAGRGR